MMKNKDLEIWKPVVGYEGSYEVSNFGNVRGLDRFVHRKSALGKEQMIPVKGKILTKRLNEQGYYKADLSKVVDGKKSHKGFLVSRLVAIAFIPNAYNKPFVNHINGIPTDNYVENLEWCTPSENTIHAYETGLMFRAKGEKSPLSKLTQSQASSIRKEYADGNTTTYKLADKYNISRRSIHRVLNNLSYAE